VFAAVLDAVMDREQIPTENKLGAAYRAAEAIGGFFRISSAGMTALIGEMESQGMTERAPDAVDKLRRKSGTITPEEIGALLEDYDPLPTRPPEPRRSGLDQFFARLTLEEPDLKHGDGAEALMTLHPLAWCREWIRWLLFLKESEEHGGVVVG
jgi:hypothetical protein